MRQSKLLENQVDLKKVIRPVILIVALMVAVYTIVHLWNYYNAAPWTRDGTQSLISQTSLRTDPNKNLMYYQK
jgi:multidrug resistance efflux pump